MSDICPCGVSNMAVCSIGHLHDRCRRIAVSSLCVCRVSTSSFASRESSYAKERRQKERRMRRCEKREGAREKEDNEYLRRWLFTHPLSFLTCSRSSCVLLFCLAVLLLSSSLHHFLTFSLPLSLALFISPYSCLSLSIVSQLVTHACIFLIEGLLSSPNCRDTQWGFFVSFFLERERVLTSMWFSGLVCGIFI